MKVLFMFLILQTIKWYKSKNPDSIKSQDLQVVPQGLEP